nr:hypothetical protein [Tanacetum cinerariifolium]
RGVTSVVVKKINDVIRLQARVDRKKVVITEDTIRDALRLADAEGIECLPNKEIFTELSRIGYTFFEGIIVAQEVSEGANDVKVKDVPPAGVAAEGVASVADDDVNADVDEPSIPSPTPPTQSPPPSQDIPSTSQGKEVGDEEQAESVQAEETKEDEDVILEDTKDVVVEKTAEIEEKPTEVQEVVEVVTTAKLITEVVTAASATITSVDTPIPTAIITAAASKLTTASSASRRRKGVVIKDPEETSTPSIIIHTEPKSKDKGTGIMDEVIDQVKRKGKEDNVVMRYQALKRKPQTEAQSRKNMMIHLRNMVGFKMDYFRGISYDDIRPIFEKYFNSNVAFLEKTKEQMDEKDNKAFKMISESQEDKAAKRQKLDEEVEELRRHLQIVPNDEDDVYTEATPLALNVYVVDYKIYTEHNKPYYKIKRANGSHQIYISFLHILKNFNREDLEALWRLVKERFASTKPKNFSNDFLLTTLRAMFEKPDV